MIYTDPEGVERDADVWSDGPVEGGWAKTKWLMDDTDFILVGLKHGDKSIPKKYHQIRTERRVKR